MQHPKEFTGETIGTFLLVLFGCGSVAVSVLFNAHQGLMQIALAWGFGVTLAIYCTRHLSSAHLNPAVSIAMVCSKNLPLRKLPKYIAAQFLGASLAALTLYGLFSASIEAYETTHHIIRGTQASVATAKMFGEYYTQSGGTAIVSLPLAIAAEAFGTFLLVLSIYFLTSPSNTGRPNSSIAPFFIGLTVTSVICLIAPLTQAGLNPARDLAPRLVAWAFGWGDAAFPDQSAGFLLVYVLGPIIGAILASFLFTKLIEPQLKANQ